MRDCRAELRHRSIARQDMNLFRPPSGIAFGFDPFGNVPEVRQNTPDVRVLRQVSNGAFDVSIMTVGMTDPQLHAFGRSIFWHCPNECARSEEHTSELQSLMRISYAVFCLKKKTNTTT